MGDKGLNWGNFILSLFGLGGQIYTNKLKILSEKEIGLLDAKSREEYYKALQNAGQNAPDKGVDLMKIGMILGGFLFLVVILVLFKGGGNNAPQPVAYVPQVASVQQGVVR